MALGALKWIPSLDCSSIEEEVGRREGERLAVQATGDAHGHGYLQEVQAVLGIPAIRGPFFGCEVGGRFWCPVHGRDKKGTNTETIGLFLFSSYPKGTVQRCVLPRNCLQQTKPIWCTQDSSF